MVTLGHAFVQNLPLADERAANDGPIGDFGMLGKWYVMGGQTVVLTWAGN
jgi:hypothetical protein